MPAGDSQLWWFDVETTNSWETPGSYPTAYSRRLDYDHSCT